VRIHFYLASLRTRVPLAQAVSVALSIELRNGRCSQSTFNTPIPGRQDV
jgi:hypothetical protein